MFKLAKKCEQSAQMEVWWQQGEIRDAKGHFPHLFPRPFFLLSCNMPVLQQDTRAYEKGPPSARVVLRW